MNARNQKNQNSARWKANIEVRAKPRAPTVLLLSDDESLAKLVHEIVKLPWKVVHHRTAQHLNREVFYQPNVRLVIFDDQGFEETDHGWMLAQIRKRFSGVSLLYVASIQSDANEKRARTNGAHYYSSKPLSLTRFGDVLQSFLEASVVP